jgi:enoyl-CoA hydratase/carnithine racemase
MAPIDFHEVEVPDSYSTLPVEHIKISNHPENAAGVTPVQIITLNRPKQRNAFTARMTEDLILAYNTFDVDERVKCVVLTGAGDSFCAGADLQMGFSALGRAERMQDNRDTYETHVAQRSPICSQPAVEVESLSPCSNAESQRLRH